MLITVKQLILSILSGILLFLGISIIITIVPELQNQPISHFFKPHTFHNFILHLLIIGIILTIMGITCLYKSKLIKTLIHKYS